MLTPELRHEPPAMPSLSPESLQSAANQQPTETRVADLFYQLDESVAAPVAVRLPSNARGATRMRACSRLEQDFSKIKLHDTTAKAFEKFRTVPTLQRGFLGQGHYTRFIHNMVTVKKAYAQANCLAGRLSETAAKAIIGACDDIHQNPQTYAAYLWTPLYMGGCRTPFNMNINGVIAARANERLTEQGVNDVTINANDHVNLGQSTNDTIPASVMLSVCEQLDDLSSSLDPFKLTLSSDSDAFEEIVNLQQQLHELKLAGLSNLPLLATAAGSGATAKGLEPHLYQCLNQLLTAQGVTEQVKPHANLAHATIDTSWYVKVENCFGEIAELLSEFTTEQPDLTFLLDQVRVVGTQIVKGAHEKGAAFSLNSMDPQFDWTIMMDYQRLAQVMEVLTHLQAEARHNDNDSVGDADSSWNGITSWTSESDNDTNSVNSVNDADIGKLIRQRPQQAVLASQQTVAATHEAIQATDVFALKEQSDDKLWLTYTEHQPAVPVNIASTLQGYANEYRRAIDSATGQTDSSKTTTTESTGSSRSETDPSPERTQAKPRYQSALEKIDQGEATRLSVSERAGLRTYLSELDILLSVMERTAKDFTQRNKERSLTLETIGPGSSIMPGKINPVVCEFIQMLANEGSAHINFLKQSLTSSSQKPAPDAVRLAAYQLDTIHQCVTTAANNITRLMEGTNINHRTARHHILTSGSLSTMFRDKQTEDGETIDYSVAGALTKALKAQQLNIPETTYETLLGDDGKTFANAQGTPVRVTADDTERWTSERGSDWVAGIDPNSIVVGFKP